MSALEKLLAFESRCDSHIASLSLWGYPVRSVLSCFFLLADSIWIGGRSRRLSTPDPNRAAALVSRLSYLVPFIRGGSTEVGSDLRDAMSVFESDGFKQALEAATYAHLCELIPDARRGLYSVHKTSRGFCLEHKNPNAALAEMNDVLLNELSLPFSVNSPHQDRYLSWVLKMMAENKSVVLPTDQYCDIVKSFSDFYASTLDESILLDDSAFEEAFCFSREHFRHVRSAMFGVADLCSLLAEAMVALRGHDRARSDDIINDKLELEIAEWTAPLLLRSFVMDLLRSTTELESDDIERILEYFTIDSTKRESYQLAGDGYFPPLIRLDDGWLFSPIAIKLMMPERNILYSLNRIDPEHFASKVANALENALILEALESIQQVPGLETACNIVWASGEIDLLVYDPIQNSALHCQAKAGIPPQGSRMTRQIESRTMEAIAQLDKFERLPAAEKDRICSRAVRHSVTGVNWRRGILTRSCIGGVEAWNALKGTTPLNLFVLKRSIAESLRQRDPSLNQLLERASTVLGEIAGLANASWRHAEIELLGHIVEFPILEFESEVIIGIRSATR